MRAGAPHPRCLFCGSEAVVAAPVEGIEIPETFLPFEADDAKIRESFRARARASIWYPGDLRDARLDLARLLLPAWTWDGEVETHWAALVHAATRSGKRPTTGKGTQRLRGILVPSSSALTRAELDAIAPFDGGHAFLFRAEEAVAPFELGKLTRSAARAAACEALAAAHRAQIGDMLQTTVVSGSHVFSGLAGRPVLLPVYVGVFVRGGRPYRVVVNGQTGRITGDFPISWWRVGCAVLGGLVLIFGLLVFLALFAYLAGVVA
jgi:hypothetical protein